MISKLVVGNLDFQISRAFNFAWDMTRRKIAKSPEKENLTIKIDHTQKFNFREISKFCNLDVKTTKKIKFCMQKWPKILLLNSTFWHNVKGNSLTTFNKRSIGELTQRLMAVVHLKRCMEPSQQRSSDLLYLLRRR